jgi:hypothetical protein
MNASTDRKFFDLAMKVLSKQATDDERRTLESMRKVRPELDAEFQRLIHDVDCAKEVAPILQAMGATEPRLPLWARHRLTKEQRALRKLVDNKSSPGRELRDYLR